MCNTTAVNSLIATFVLLINLTLIEEALSVPVIGNRSSRVVTWEQNKRNFEMNKCRDPKPELHYLSTFSACSLCSQIMKKLRIFPDVNGDSSNDADDFMAEFDPPVAVVNRCSNRTGCCENNGMCVMATEETVTYVVKIKDTDSEVPITIKNHLSCKCVQKMA